MDDNKKKRGNPMWVANGPSPNPQGRKLHSALSVSGILERIYRKEFNVKQASKRIKGLTDSQWCDMNYKIASLLVTRDGVSEDQLTKAFQLLEDKMTQDAQKKAG